MDSESDIILHMASPTHYANLMIRVMVAHKMLSYIPGLRISNVDLPYWNISNPSLGIRLREKTCRLVAEQHVPFNQVRYLSEAGLISRLEWFGYGQRMENFPSKQFCRALFQAHDDVGVVLPEDCLLCPIRAEEILDAIHPGYTVVPVDFYEALVEETNLRPVFMGQTADNVFTSKLRARFPNAKFLPHRNVLEDFQTIRKAKNIVLPISTFAWLAAWLSDAASIILPVFGIFNPRLYPLHDLLPLGESHYRFFQFPECDAVPLNDLEGAHKAIKGKWNEVDSLALASFTL